MKTMLLKNPFFSLMLAVFVLLALPSCDKDDETPEQSFTTTLVGTWDITSYVLDDDEWLGLIMDSASITFEEPTGNNGIFTQEVTFTDGESFSLSSRYIIDEALSQVVMYYEGEPITADITFTGINKMHWESIQDEYPLVLKATKRP